jgi:geranylgeranyl pyrophosphate synthase
LRELGLKETPAIVKLVAAWFTLVHISGPIDHWADNDPLSSPWRSLGRGEGFNVAMSLKDQALSCPLLDHPEADDAVTGLDVAKATTALASAGITVSVGSFLDIGGALDFNNSWRDDEIGRLALLHEQVVSWKCSVIYQSLMSCLAIAASAPITVQTALEEFGHNVGFSIQVLDDAGGIWGVGNDLEKSPVKLTFPIVYALTTNHKHLDEVKTLLAVPAQKRDILRLRAILDEIDTLKFLEFLIEERRERCAKTLQGVSSQTRDELLAWYNAYFRRAL